MLFRRPIKEINAEFPAEERYLGSIQRIVREACAVAGMSRRQVSSVQLALEEGATNVIRHAYLYEKGLLRLRIVIYRKLIVFSLIDSGRSFQPTGSATLDLEKLVESGRRGGLGFYMIQKIMDSVEYITSGGQNELRMVKRLHAVPSSGAPFLRRLWSLRMKFSVGTLLVVSLIVLIAFFFVDRNSTGRVRRQLDETVAALCKTVADQASGYILNHRSHIEFDELVRSYVHSNPDLERIVLVDSTGRILANSGEELAGIGSRYVPPPGVDTSFIGRPQSQPMAGGKSNVLIMLIHNGDQEQGKVFVNYSSARVDAQLRAARLQALLVTGLLLLIGVIGIYLLSSYFVTPIVKITRRVRRYTSGDLETELPLEGAEEFFEISRALNEMTTRLSRDRKHLIERERLAKEIEVASQIQKTLLPGQLPEISGLEVDAFYRAASLVGGDLYDVFEIEGGRYCLVVADVSGKGVPGSLVMSMLRTVIRIFSRSAHSPRETLVAVNDYLSDNMPPGLFVTVFLALFYPENNELKFVSAGHNPLLYYRARTGRVESVNPAGMPLGVPASAGNSFADRLEEQSICLEAGDSAFVYTDGVTESTGRNGDQFGADRIARLLQEQLAREKVTLADVSAAIVADLDSFAGSDNQADDITFLILRSVVPKTAEPAEEIIETRSVTDDVTDAANPDPTRESS